MKWLFKSNRFSHLIVGGLATFAMFMLNGLLSRFCDPNIGNAIITLLVVLFAMMAVEVTQVECKASEQIDYLDVFAGCIPAIVALICIIISVAIK